MGEPKFTPGPWKVSGATHVYAPGPNGANVCSCSDPRASTIVGYTDPDIESPGLAEAAANATAIAALPDLIDALAPFVAAFGKAEAELLAIGEDPSKMPDDYADRFGLTTGDWRRARAALAKAAPKEG